MQNVGVVALKDMPMLSPGRIVFFHLECIFLFHFSSFLFVCFSDGGVIYAA